MGNGGFLPILGHGTRESLAAGTGVTPRITALLIKPASAVCNLDCSYCFYLDREADPYKELPARVMSEETLERMVDTYLFYSYPQSAFAFQGGEPTLAGLAFFQKLVMFQRQYGRGGQAVSNSIQTNGILIDNNWCDLFLETDWLLGVSLDGPEGIHDLYRLNRGGKGTWRQVMKGVETLQRRNVSFNILCVLSNANVEKPKELYQFFRGVGIEHVQFIPLAEFHPDGSRMPFTITPEQYGHFLVEMFDLWWPDRRKFRIRFFDNLAEAFAGMKPGCCAMHESCDSYVVVEFNGDVFPCDFFVESGWKLGNVNLDIWPEIARRQRRYDFSQTKSIPHEECSRCKWQSVCHQGCPKFRHAPHGRFEDLDCFCEAYKMIYAKAEEPLRKDLRKLLGGRAGERGQGVGPSP